MDSLPPGTECWDVRLQEPVKLVHLWPGEPKVLAQLDRSGRTVQVEDRLSSTIPDVHVRGTMIVGEDHDPPAAKSEDGRHAAL